jgi:hypothetical protein
MMDSDGLRPIVEALDREMSRFLSGGADAANRVALLACWAKLVEFLALAPTPELRECPLCRSKGVRAASLCGMCWTKLEPYPPLGIA